MKILFLLSFVLSSFSSLGSSNATALRRSNKLLRFIAQQEGLRNSALSSLIGTRCSRYMEGDNKGLCKEAVKEMIGHLDFDVIFAEELKPSSVKKEWSPKSFVFVAFKTKLNYLLEDPKTKSYLNHLNQELYNYLLDGRHSVNIWDLTKKYFKSDFETAEAIAVLFQDTSRMKLHLGYLEQTRPEGSKLYVENKELLDRVIDAINLILDNSEEHYRKLFYPEEIQKYLNRNIYHFYVPLYLAKILRKEGLKSDYAYKAPMMLTLTYEFVTTTKSYGNILFDPKSIENRGTIHDIYGGHCGSTIGAYGGNRYQSFEDVSETFTRSTREGVELLIIR